MRSGRGVRQLKFRTAILLIALLCGVAHADMQSGLTAYQAGEYEKAQKEFKKFAALGNPDAQVNLGLMYARGQGVKQDYKEAANWYRKAAEQGQQDAQFNLGSLYYDGLGVKRDYKLAAEWYTKAAQQGQADAQFNLGLMHATGQGVPQSFSQAYQWFSIAAAKGDKEAEQSKKLAADKLTPEELDKAQAAVAAWWAGRK